jgi:hypothetical protein
LIRDHSSGGDGCSFALLQDDLSSASCARRARNSHHGNTLSLENLKAPAPCLLSFFAHHREALLRWQEALPVPAPTPARHPPPRRPLR